MFRISEERKKANEAIEKEAESQIPRLQRELRQKASSDPFAWECWEYYVKNYTGTRFKSSSFSRNYLTKTLETIEAM